MLDKLLDILLKKGWEKLSRQEAVIRILRQLGLDPEQPPKDFEGVYNYALVEYGLGQDGMVKPKPCLDIFRTPQIYDCFKQAFRENSPQLFLQGAEDFLEDSAVGRAVLALGYAPRRELVAFAAVFVAITKRSRTPAEMLMAQELDSVHQTVAQLIGRLDRLPTLEGMRTEMARLAGSEGGLSLPGVSEKACRALALAQQMRGWFETLGYRFESHEVWDEAYFEWMINIPVRRGRYDRILVRGIDGEAELHDVMAVAAAMEAQRADEAWLVTARRISQAARQQVAQPEYEAILCCTWDELLDQDADFSGYLDWLEGEIHQRQIDTQYVPLACVKEELDPRTHQRLGVSRYGAEDGWIEGYVDRWVDDPTKEHLSVLGEFGTGKTWFALHYAGQALQAYREAQRRGMERPRLPIVIPLRDYAKAVSVESLFSEFFFRKHEIPIPGYSAFEQLNRMGKLLLIFDGFDEMAARVDKQEMINNFWELAKVVVPGSKVILTCRTEHFPEAKEGRALLNAELQASTKNLTGETPQFEVLELEKFDDDQIRQVLGFQASASTVDVVMGNSQLLDLARRPVMAELILEALPDIEAGKPVDMSRVYLYAVRRKMERDIKAERTFTSMADKLYFLCELSWEMLSTDRMSLNYREFPDQIRKLFGEAVQEEKDLDHWHYDMMGQTMLVRNADGDYTPAHRSLLEFFVAFKFAAEIGALSTDFLELAQMRGNIELSLPAQEYTWSEYFEIQPSIHPLANFKAEILTQLKRSFGKSPLTKAVIDLLTPMLVEFTQQDKEPLITIIQETRGKTEDLTKYVGGNAATLLIHLRSDALSHTDLSRTFIQGADFSSAQLWNANFFQATIRDTSFSQMFGSIFTLAYSPKGDIFATAGATSDINLWNSENDHLIGTLSGHMNWVRHITFSRDGRLLISASFDQSIRVWDLERLTCIHILNGHTSRINFVSISSDSKYLASAGDDKSIRIWDLEIGRCIRTIDAFGAEVESVIIDNKTNRIISGGADKSIRIWNLETGESLSCLAGHSKRIRYLAISPNGKILASASRDRTVRLWDVETGTCLNVLKGHSDRRLYAVAFNPDGSLLATGGYDTTIKIWDVMTGECCQTLLGHIDWVRTVSFNCDGTKLTSGSDDQTIRHWNVSTGECITTLHGYSGEIRSISVARDAQYLALGCEDKYLRIWKGDFHDAPNISSYASLSGHTGRVCTVSISPTDHIVATGSFDCLTKIWSLTTHECLKTLEGHTSCVNAVTFSPDGRVLVTASADCSLRLWNVKTGECIKTLKGHDNWLWAVAISPDNQIIASAGDDQIIRFWDMQGNCHAAVKEHRGGINSVVFTPNSKVLISGGGDRKIRLWDVSSKKCLKSWLAHEESIGALDVSPNGYMLVSSGNDKCIKIWDLNTGSCLKILHGHTDRIRSVVFSPDGSKVISGCFDQTVRIWDVTSGEQLTMIRTPRPYEGMNITGIKGLTSATIASLKALGAIDEADIEASP